MDGKQRDYGSGEPGAVLEAAISALQQPRASSGPPFVAAATFSGRRPGYYFGTSSTKGTG